MMAPTHEQIARTAAAWWVEQVRSKPEQRMTCRGDSATDLVMNVWTQSQSAATNEGLEKFQAVLEQEIIEGLAELESGEGWANDSFHLHCDYEPQGSLLVAAQEAGVNLRLFPIKTRMWVYADKVEVRVGYGGTLEELPIVE